MAREEKRGGEESDQTRITKGVGLTNEEDATQNKTKHKQKNQRKTSKGKAKESRNQKSEMGIQWKKMEIQQQTEKKPNECGRGPHKTRRISKEARGEASSEISDTSRYSDRIFMCCNSSQERPYKEENSRWQEAIHAGEIVTIFVNIITNASCTGDFLGGEEQNRRKHNNVVEDNGEIRKRRRRRNSRTFVMIPTERRRRRNG